MNSHAHLFNRIAFAYQWFFKLQIKSYQKTIKKNLHHLKLHKGARVLDIGCGTGAFAYSLEEHGYDVTGVDIAPNMIEKAAANGVDCRQGDITAGLDFADDSFDLVTAAYVAHGLPSGQRKELYRETQRLSRDRVIFHDYRRNNNLIISIIEFLEGGHYFTFRKKAAEEMSAVFDEVTRVPLGSWNCWYICR